MWNTQDLQYSQCGRCGDIFGESHATQGRWTEFKISRTNGTNIYKIYASVGGQFDKAIITGTYTAGQIIDVVVEITANHRGHFELELCSQTTETDNCFQPLILVGGSHEIRHGNRMCVGPSQVLGQIRARVQLPANVRCTRCTLRWTYRTSYPPGNNLPNRYFPNLLSNDLFPQLPIIVSIRTQHKHSETVLISE